MIDMHSHVLPDLDDGPKDMAGALALARAAVAAGTELLVATPHVGTRHAVDPFQIAVRVWELERALEQAQIPLAVATGAELAPAGVSDLSDADLAAVGLGGSRCVLLECPFTPAGDQMHNLVSYLQGRGMRVLLAHPERSPSFVRDMRRIEELVAQGAFVQVTAGALTGAFGTPAWRLCSVLLERGLVHVVASDAHDAARRPPELASVVEQVVWEQGLPQDLTAHLVQAVPRALLDDAPVPSGPRSRRRPRRLRRR